MARFRRSKGRKGGSGGSGGSWGSMALIVFGCVSLLVAIIMFSVALEQLDTAMTDVASYTEFVGLGDVMGIFGLIIFLAFMILGLGAIGGGAYLNIKKAMGGSWSSLMMVAIMGGITLVIAAIMNTIVLGQLDTAYDTAANVSLTANIADMVGLLDVMGIFGIVIFVTLIGAGLSMLGSAGFGAYKQVKG